MSAVTCALTPTAAVFNFCRRFGSRATITDGSFLNQKRKSRLPRRIRPRPTPWSALEWPAEPKGRGWRQAALYQPSNGNSLVLQGVDVGIRVQARNQNGSIRCRVPRLTVWAWNPFLER